MSTALSSPAPHAPAHAAAAVPCAVPERDALSLVLHAAASIPQACMTQTDPIVARSIATPLGEMVAAASRDGLCLLEFADRPSLEREVQTLSRVLSRGFVSERSSSSLARLAPGLEHVDAAQAELEAYFAGRLRDFSVALNLPGSPFERRVWARLQTIPYGETTSYGRMAFRLGQPGAARAVGRANGRNRVAIIVPCHRVVHEDGTLCGYGGGLERKQRLLDLESDTSVQPALFA
jgi:AraC family transcriptional regulator of adaptative response/methylated-DNA-[protein]-cysteine methyltransferase